MDVHENFIELQYLQKTDTIVLDWLGFWIFFLNWNFGGWKPLKGSGIEFSQPCFKNNFKMSRLAMIYSTVTLMSKGYPLIHHKHVINVCVLSILKPFSYNNENKKINYCTVRRYWLKKYRLEKKVRRASVIISVLSRVHTVRKNHW